MRPRGVRSIPRYRAELHDPHGDPHYATEAGKDIRQEGTSKLRGPSARRYGICTAKVFCSATQGGKVRHGPVQPCQPQKAGHHASGLSQGQLVETTYGIEEGAAAFEQVMTSTSDTTAVFCGNDVLAVGALHRARDLGISVPRDVSVVGFDDIELAQVTYGQQRSSQTNRSGWRQRRWPTRQPGSSGQCSQKNRNIGSQRSNHANCQEMQDVEVIMRN